MNMQWLPKPFEFSKQISSIKKASPQEAWALLAAAAQHDLNFLETMQVDQALKEKFGAEPPLQIPTQPIRLAVLSSSTVEQLLPGIRVGGLRRNLWVSTYVTDYGQSLQELMDFSSPLHQFKPTVV